MPSRAADGATRQRCLALVAAVALAIAVVLVAVGRWERARQIDGQIAGLERVRRTVGPLDQPSLSGYRVLPQFDCLVYRRGSNPFALELCIDRAGKLVEAIDRRRNPRRYWTLRSEPTTSSIRVDRAEVDRLLRRMGAPTSP